MFGVLGIGDAVTFDVAATLVSRFNTGIRSDDSVDTAEGVAFAATTGSGSGRATQRPPAMATATADRPAATNQRFRPAVPVACECAGSSAISDCGANCADVGFGADGVCGAGGIAAGRASGITTVASGSSLAAAA